jgi:hypothetical protein
LAGTRERISTRGSSGRAATAPSFLEQSMPPRVICRVGIEMEMSVNARAREIEQRQRGGEGSFTSRWRWPGPTAPTRGGPEEAEIERGIGEISEP